MYAINAINVCMYVCMYVLAQMLDGTLQYLPHTCADPCCYVIGSFPVHAQTDDVTLHDLLLYTRRQLMQRYKELQDIFSYFRNASCCVTRSSLALAQTLRATLIDRLLFLHRHLRL